jgi:hypothetical protein
MFAASRFPDARERQGIEAALRANLSDRDYLSLGLTEAFPSLGAQIARERIFVLPPNLLQVAAAIKKGAGTGTAGLIVYDGEHWEGTPDDEQRNLPAAVNRGKAMTARSPAHRFALSPDGVFSGVRPSRCTYDLEAALHRHLDWADVAIFILQAQTLLSDTCFGQGGAEAYVGFVQTVSREIRQSNPRVQVVAQMSFRATPPERMVKAIAALHGTVDGFYLAYPRNIGPVCQYCSPDNLELVLRAVHAGDVGTRPPAPRAEPGHPTPGP